MTLVILFIKYSDLIRKVLWDFDIQTDHLISARRPDLVMINKKKRTCRIVDFLVPADEKLKLKESEKNDKYLDLAREKKKHPEHENDDYTNWYSHQNIGKKMEDL